jgi:hypothetical protein
MTAHSGHQGPGRTNRLILERLTSLDLSNLRIEAHGHPMNVAALVILEGGALLDRYRCSSDSTTFSPTASPHCGCSAPCSTPCLTPRSHRPHRG